MTFATFETLLGGCGVGGSEALRQAFIAACELRSDTGSGWDAPAVGQMTLFQFVEALSALAPRLAVEGSAGAEADGLAPLLHELVARAWAKPKGGEQL